MATEARHVNNETEIRTLIDIHVKALRAKDADAVVLNYAEDNVMFVMAPPLQYKSDNSPDKQGVEEWFATWEGPLGYEVRDLRITAGDDVAFSHSLNRMSGTKTDGIGAGRGIACFSWCFVLSMLSIFARARSIPALGRSAASINH